MKKFFIIAAVFCIGIAFGLILTHGTLNAQGANSDSDVLSKLNDIAKSQGELMAAVNSIKEDLQIVKIRITQMQ